MENNILLESCLKLIMEADTAYLATINDAKLPEMRAMLNLRFEDQFPGLAPFMKKHAQGFETYFTTNTASRKIKQIEANANCSVYFNIGYNGLLLLGTIEIATDTALKEELWQDGWELYYPKGKKDPDYAVQEIAL